MAARTQRTVTFLITSFSGWRRRATSSLYPNPRGITSYGQDFGNIIQYKYPGDDFKDLMAGVDEVFKRGYIDDDEARCNRRKRRRFTGELDGDADTAVQGGSVAAGHFGLGELVVYGRFPHYSNHLVQGGAIRGRRRI